MNRTTDDQTETCSPPVSGGLVSTESKQYDAPSSVKQQRIELVVSLESKIGFTAKEDLNALIDSYTAEIEAFEVVREANRRLHQKLEMLSQVTYVTMPLEKP